jgi:hypothetical protein
MTARIVSYLLAFMPSALLGRGLQSGNAVDNTGL